jgi:hypothetical protein
MHVLGLGPSALIGSAIPRRVLQNDAIPIGILEGHAVPLPMRIVGADRRKSRSQHSADGCIPVSNIGIVEYD